jgi:hypothetical protein
MTYKPIDAMRYDNGRRSFLRIGRYTNKSQIIPITIETAIPARTAIAKEIDNLTKQKKTKYAAIVIVAA